MSKIRCLSGVTQIASILKHALREVGQRKVGALCFVGDAAEEPRSQLISPARELAGAGVPAFMFLEGEDSTARTIFQEIAQVTGGAFGHFDQNSARMLADLLKAVAAFAAGGRLALEKQGGSAAKLLLGQIRLGEADMPITLKDINAALALLAEDYPSCFVLEQYQPHRPLKIGIDRDSRNAAQPWISRERGVTLRFYICRLMYLQSLVEGADRVDLDGNPVGKVSAQDAGHARGRTRRNHRHTRCQGGCGEGR